MLHPPGVFHAVRADGTEGLSLFVLSFDSRSPALHALTEDVQVLGTRDKQLLGDILVHAREAFSSNLGEDYFRLRRRLEAPFGAEQMISLHFEMLLLSLLRQREDRPILADGAASKDRQDDRFEEAVTYMKEHLTQALKVEEICQRMLMSRSKLQRIFRAHAQKGVMEYYIALRMDAAKAIMRSRAYNFSQIAEMMGFSSIHYFSRQFKRVTGMTPTDYCLSLRARTDKMSC